MSNLPLDTKRFDFLQSALDGSKGFSDGAYLTKFGRESDKKYQARKELAWYVNHLKPMANRFVGYLTKKPPTRDIAHPLVESFANDCDWRGNEIDIFLSGFYESVKAKGCGLVLVDMPNFTPANLAQQVQTRFFPYLVQLNVEHVISYSLNVQGLLESIEISTQMMIDGQLTDIVRGWDITSWWVKRNGNVIEQGEHNLGVCPVIALSEGDSFPYVGSFAQIADISKRLYNLHSELDELLRGQTFSILSYQIPTEQAGQLNTAGLAESVGTNNMLVYQGNNAPAFVTPNTGPVDSYHKTIETLEQKIKDIGMVIDFSKNSSAESGVALSIRFEALNSALAAFARKAEDFERRLFDMVSRWLAIENTTIVSYQKSFELADIEAELNTLALYSQSAFPQEVIKAKQKQIVSLDFSNLENEDLQSLLDAIDLPDPEANLVDSRLSVLEAAINQDTGNQNNGGGL